MMVENDPPNQQLFKLDPDLHFLIRLRLSLNYDRNQLAQLLAVNYDTVWQWETGRRSPSFTWQQILVLEKVLTNANLKFSDFPTDGGPTRTAPNL